MSYIGDLGVIKVILIVCIILAFIILVVVTVLWAMSYRDYHKIKQSKELQRDKTIKNLTHQLQANKKNSKKNHHFKGKTNIYTTRPEMHRMPVHYKPYYKPTAYPPLPVISEEPPLVLPPAGTFDLRPVHMKKGRLVYHHPKPLFYMDYDTDMRNPAKPH